MSTAVGHFRAQYRQRFCRLLQEVLGWSITNRRGCSDHSVAMRASIEAASCTRFNSQRMVVVVGGVRRWMTASYRASAERGYYAENDHRTRFPPPRAASSHARRRTGGSVPGRPAPGPPVRTTRRGACERVQSQHRIVRAHASDGSTTRCLEIARSVSATSPSVGPPGRCGARTTSFSDNTPTSNPCASTTGSRRIW